jgi:hypothetical protein
MPGGIGGIRREQTASVWGRIIIFGSEKMAFPSEPLNEDDCPEDVRVVSFSPFEQEGEKISLNYIKEEDQEFFRPLNIQIEEGKTVSGKRKGNDNAESTG